MNNSKTALLATTFLLLTANFAVAGDKDSHRCHGDSRWCVSAPEIDPGEAMGALALLGGSIAIIRGYRRRKK
jgi:hypothetical protein